MTPKVHSKQLILAAKELERALATHRDVRVLIDVPDGSGIDMRFAQIDIGKELREYAALLDRRATDEGEAVAWQQQRYFKNGEMWGQWESISKDAYEDGVAYPLNGWRYRELIVKPRSAAPDGERVSGEHSWSEYGNTCRNCGSAVFHSKCLPNRPVAPTPRDASSATTPNVNEISSSLVVGNATSEAVAWMAFGLTENVFLPHHAASTKHGVYVSIMDAARREGFSGTIDERISELGWDVRPVFDYPAPQQRQADAQPKE